MTKPTSSDILVIDVGATSIKSTVVSLTGERLQPIHKRKTPRPLGPTELIQILFERVQLEEPTRVAVGVPVECHAGVVSGSGNLARSGAISSKSDESLEQRWQGFCIEQEFAKVSKRDVIVLNDAALAALGCVSGSGIELVLALGTGFGVALAHAGILQEVADYGEIEFKGDRFDGRLGEAARRNDEARWKEDLNEVIRLLVDEHEAERVWLVGGNAKRLKVADFANQAVPVLIAGNEAPFSGGATVFNNPLAIGR
jgi:polyphosphate glucokinase